MSQRQTTIAQVVNGFSDGMLAFVRIIAGFRRQIAHNRDVEPFVAKPLLRRLGRTTLPDRELDQRMQQQCFELVAVGSAGRCGMNAVHKKPLAGAQANAAMLIGEELLEQFREFGGEPGSRTIAADRHKRNARMCAGRVKQIHDGRADRLRLSVQRRDVHGERRTGVDLQDRAALRFQRFANILCDDVQAGDVQADDAGRQNGFGRIRRMNVRRAVGGQVADRLNPDAAARLGDRVRIQPLFPEFDQGGIIQLQQSQLIGVILAAARIAIHLFDQLANRRTPVARDELALAPRGGDQSLSDDQQPVGLSQRVLFDHHARIVPILDRPVESGQDLLPLRQIQRDPAGMVRAARLDDDRKADFTGGRPSVFGVVDRPAERHRDADRAEQTLGKLFVLGNAFSDRAGRVGLRRPNPPLAGAFAKLHEAAGVQSPVHHAPFAGRLHDCAGTRAKPHVVGQIHKSAGYDRRIDLFARQRRAAKLQGGFQARHREAGRFDRQGKQVHPRLIGLRGPALRQHQPRRGLKQLRQQPQQIGNRQAAIESGEKPSAQRHSPRVILPGKARGVSRQAIEPRHQKPQTRPRCRLAKRLPSPPVTAIDVGFEHRRARPSIRTRQRYRFDAFHTAHRRKAAGNWQPNAQAPLYNPGCLAFLETGRRKSSHEPPSIQLRVHPKYRSFNLVARPRDCVLRNRSHHARRRLATVARASARWRVARDGTADSFSRWRSESAVAFAYQGRLLGTRGRGRTRLRDRLRNRQRDR